MFGGSRRKWGKKKLNIVIVGGVKVRIFRDCGEFKGGRDFN